MPSTWAENPEWSGLLVMILSVPDCELEPNSVPCGPGRDSMRAMSIMRTSTCCEIDVIGCSSRYTATWLSVRYSAEPVEMPRMMTEFRPGMALTRFMLGSAFTKSSIFWKAWRWMSSLENAVMLCGTSCRLVSRRVAVTTISSRPCACCARADPAGTRAETTAAASGVICCDHWRLMSSAEVPEAGLREQESGTTGLIGNFPRDCSSHAPARRRHAHTVAVRQCPQHPQKNSASPYCEIVTM